MTDLSGVGSQVSANSDGARSCWRALIGFLTLLGVVFGAVWRRILIGQSVEIFGHPIHPGPFSDRLWNGATVAYGLVACGVSELADARQFSNGAGLLLAMFAMLAGLLELGFIDSSSDAMGVASWSMMAMATVWICFLLALLLSLSTGFDQAAARLGEARSRHSC